MRYFEILPILSDVKAAHDIDINKIKKLLAIWNAEVC